MSHRPGASRKPRSDAPERAIAWLQTQPPGTKVTTAQIREAIGYAGRIGSLRWCLSSFIASGEICQEYSSARSGRGGSGFALWSLPQQSQEPQDGAEPEPERDPLPVRREAPHIKPRPGLLFPGVYATEVAA